MPDKCLQKCSHMRSPADDSGRRLRWPAGAGQGKEGNQEPSAKADQTEITAGTRTFEATLEDNGTARAFEAMLPLTIRMADLHANEKFHRFRKNFPTQTLHPGKSGRGI